MEPFDTFVREWPVIQQAPVSFLSAILTTIAAVGIGAYKASSFVYKSEIGNLKSDNDTLEKKHEAKADIYEQRIKRYEQEYASLERENARLRIFAEENARKTFEGVHLHPGHKITINIPAPQAAVLPQYRPLVELGMLKVEEIAPSVSTVASTGTAAKLWDSVQQSSKR